MIKDEEFIAQDTVHPIEWLYDGDDIYCAED